MHVAVYVGKKTEEMVETELGVLEPKVTAWLERVAIYEGVRSVGVQRWTSHLDGQAYFLGYEGQSDEEIFTSPPVRSALMVLEALKDPDNPLKGRVVVTVGGTDTE